MVVCFSWCNLIKETPDPRYHEHKVPHMRTQNKRSVSFAENLVASSFVRWLFLLHAVPSNMTQFAHKTFDQKIRVYILHSPVLWIHQALQSRRVLGDGGMD